MPSGRPGRAEPAGGVRPRAQLDDLRALADDGAAIDWLHTRSKVAGRRIGTIGFCMGGTFVLNLTAERDDLATVCSYGFPNPPRLGDNPGPVPLEQLSSMRGPIVGFWGDEDESVGMENVASFARGAEREGVDFQHVVYQGVGHGFLARALTDGEHPGHQHASDAWRRTLAFYRRHLG